MLIDYRILELLSSKLCHDIISPVSAINNGVELIDDIGGDIVAEAMNLIGNSARNASRRLRLFRVAYGRSGGEANLTVHDVKQVAEQVFEGTKIKFAWPDSQPPYQFVEYRGALKTLLNGIMLAEESLAYGGEISIASLPNESQFGCRIVVTGRAAQLSEPFVLALEGKVSVEDVNARTIHAYYTGKCAKHYGVIITRGTADPERLELDFTITPV